MASLFLTGASGFLGGRILEHIRPDDYSAITLLSRRAPALPTHLASSDKVTIICAGIDDTDKYAQHMGPDTRIIHLAAVTGKADRETFLKVNVDGTRILLEAAVNAAVEGFLFVSSIAVSFTDRQGYHYADSKEQAERYVRQSGLRYCIARPTIILGAGSPIWDSFAALAKSSLIVLPGNGKISIQPVDVDDLAGQLLQITNSNRFNNEILEMGGPEALSMDDFVRRIHRQLKGGEARIIHLPLGMILAPLRLAEKLLPASLLPVSSGQFASFNNEGTAKSNDLVESNSADMKTVEDMLDLLAGTESHG